MRVATHDGSFHADEVFAVAALTLLLRDDGVTVVRTRDRDMLAAADLRVDVGFCDDPATGDFDHHQRDFGRERPNGVRYASFGLVWSEYGARVCGGDQAVADAVDASLVAGVDANDVGQPLSRPLFEDVRAMTINGVVGGFNARWDEAFTEAQERARFDAAVALASGVIEREIASAEAGLRAVRTVREALASATDPRLIALAVNAPWKAVVVPEAPAALFVVYPKRQGFGLECVPRELGSFANRRDLPAAWAGLENEALAEVTGVDDALFCHAKRFLVVARTRTAIERLAALALADDGE